MFLSDSFSGMTGCEPLNFLVIDSQLNQDLLSYINVVLLKVTFFELHKYLILTFGSMKHSNKFS
jgi:hypothetical protein